MPTARPPNSERLYEAAKSSSARRARPSDSNVLVTFRVTDVRCKAGHDRLRQRERTGGPDYVGELQANATIRITDH